MSFYAETLSFSITIEDNPNEKIVFLEKNGTFVESKTFHFYRCCKVCAKVEGEPCGGAGGFHGSCEPPLKCISRPPVIGTGICLG